MIKALFLTCLFSACSSCVSLREKFASLTPQMPWEGVDSKVAKTTKKQKKPKETVVLLHGLWRSKRAMNKIQDALVLDGYNVINVGYPSNRKSLNDLSQYVKKQLSLHVKHGENVSFVTHSLGGIVLRDMLRNETPWKIKRVVMLAPPNHGSEIVNKLKSLKCAWILGPVNQDLLIDSVAKMPNSLPNEIELGVIMGTDSGLWVFNKLLAGENDGVVTVEGGKMKGMKDFITVDSNHTFIMLDKEVISATRQFINHGSFGRK